VGEVGDRMTYTYLDPKENDEIVQTFVDWLNDHLDDPYEQVTNKSRGSNSSSMFVIGGDLKVINLFPKLQVSYNEYDPKKITLTKTDYLEEEAHHLTFYYYNQRDRRYTFANGNTLDNDAQAIKYLIYVKKLIKTHADDFINFHKITFGSISKPIYNNSTNSHITMIPITVYTYRR